MTYQVQAASSPWLQIARSNHRASRSTQKEHTQRAHTQRAHTQRAHTQRAQGLNTYEQSAYEEKTNRNKLNNLITFKRQDQLDFVNHRLWRIHTGYIRTLTWNSEGEPVPLGFWQKGDVVGSAIVQAYPYHAECLSPVVAEHLTIGHQPSPAMVAKQIQQSNQLLQIAYCRQAKQRLLQFICWIAADFGQSVPKGRLLNLRLTHQKIAESIGITRVTVTRLLKELEKKGEIMWTTNERLVYQSTFQQYYLANAVKDSA